MKKVLSICTAIRLESHIAVQVAYFHAQQGEQLLNNWTTSSQYDERPETILVATATFPAIMPAVRTGAQAPLEHLVKTVAVLAKQTLPYLTTTVLCRTSQRKATIPRPVQITQASLTFSFWALQHTLLARETTQCCSLVGSAAGRVLQDTQVQIQVLRHDASMT